MSSVQRYLLSLGVGRGKSLSQSLVVLLDAEDFLQPIAFHQLPTSLLLQPRPVSHIATLPRPSRTRCGMWKLGSCWLSDKKTRVPFKRPSSSCEKPQFLLLCSERNE